MKPTKKLTIDGREILIFDNVISRAEQNTISTSFHALPYFRNQYDTKKSIDVYRYYSVQLRILEAKKMNLVSRIIDLVDQSFVGETFSLKRAYINQNSFGDMSFLHRDCSVEKNNVTGLYFARTTWDAEWGGETIFYNDAKDAVYAVSPKPRRLVLFRGNLFHKIGVPTRQCLESRLALALKFTAKA